MESSGLVLSHTVGIDELSAHCETKELFPYPAGAATTVTPGNPVSKR